MKHKREAGLIAALGLVWMPAFAQDQPADEAKEAPAEEAAPAPKRPLQVTYDLGGVTYRVSGNRHKFIQYATPPQGLTVKQLRFEPTDLGGFGYGVIDLQSPFYDDYFVYGKASLFYGGTVASIVNRRNRLSLPTPVALEGSERMVTEASVRQRLGRTASLAYQYRGDQQDVSSLPALYGLHQRTYLHNVSLEGELLQGFGSLSYTDVRYYDRQNLLPDTKAKVAQASYGRQLLPGLSIEGSATRTDAQPNGGETHRVDSASIGGSLSLGPTATITAATAREWWSLPNTLSAKIQERDSGRVTVNARLAPGWTAQAGYRTVQIERERFDHSWIDAPRWNTYEAKLTGRPIKPVRLTLKGFTQSVSGYAVTTINSDTDPLYWTRRNGLTARIETGNEVWTAYGSYSYNMNQNRQRDTEVRYRNLTVGGSWQALPTVSVYAEHSSDQGSARSGETAGPGFSSFFPDGRTDVVGLNWAINPATFATVDYTDFVTDNDNPFFDPSGNYRGRFLTLGLRLKSKSGIDFDLTYAPWKYEDRVYSNWGYDAAVFGVSARGRF